MIIIVLGGVSLTALFAVWALFAIDEGLADKRLRKRNIEENAKRREAEEAEVRRTAWADARRAQRPEMRRKRDLERLARAKRGQK